MSEDNSSILFELYFDLLADTENPLAFHRWTLISSIASIMGRNIYLPFGVDQLFPNMYICLIGPSASRKSHAIAIGRKILTAAQYTKFACSKTSKEKFVEDLAIGFDMLNDTEARLTELLSLPEEDRAPCEVLISAGEFEDFMGRNNGEFISMLTNLYDPQPSYSIRKIKSASTYVHQPSINLVAGATNTTFNNTFPPEIAGQGFLSRLMLVYGGGPRQKIAWPRPPEKDIMDYISASLLKIRKTMTGQFNLSQEAYEALAEIYTKIEPLDDIRFESYNGRRHVHLLKLCMVYAAADLNKTIEYKHVIMANTTLVWTEKNMPNALGEFGKSKSGETLTKIVELCKRRVRDDPNNAIPIKELWRSVSQDFNDRSELLNAIKKLSETNKLIIVNKEYVLPVEAQMKSAAPHVDFTLLREFVEERHNEQQRESAPSKCPIPEIE